jgi:hypothetical protein
MNFSETRAVISRVAFFSLFLSLSGPTPAVETGSTTLSLSGPTPAVETGSTTAI